MKILIVEDNEMIARNLNNAIKKEGYITDNALSINDAIIALDKFKPGLIILDVCLPDGNGFEFFEKYVKDRNIRTIFLTAQNEENDIVRGLEMGADDYIIKPFFTKELIVRIKKVVNATKQEKIFKFEDFEFNLENLKATKSGKEVYLTALETEILVYLIKNKGIVIKRDRLMDKIWEFTGNDINDNTLTVYLKRIREKIGVDVIKTKKGIGYIIE